MVKCIFVQEMSTEYYYCDGMLFINAALPVRKILEVIEKHLDLE